jgi:Kef-type K+ transport system membrane component KefB
MSRDAIPVLLQCQKPFLYLRQRLPAARKRFNLKISAATYHEVAMEDRFSELAIVLVFAAAAGVLALRLRQPLIVAFIAIGVVVGPVGLDLIGKEQFGLLAELGIGLLLFIVGLKLNPALVRSVGAVAAAAAIGQMLVSLAGGYALSAGLFGLEPLAAFYVAASLTFSSTIIIVKLLSDKHEIDALYGRITLGILIVQDIVVVLLMLAMTGYGIGLDDDMVGRAMLSTVFRGLGFLAVVTLATRYLIPRLLGYFAHLPELLVLFGIAWAIGLAALGVSLGLSKEVGAFIAGVSLAATPYRIALAARLVSLRDFMLLFFFINLGVRIDVVHIGTAIGPALILSLFVLVGKPLIVILLVRMLGFGKHTSAMTGFSVGQVSEFSLILAALGVELGHISDATVGLITLVGLITIGLSTYMIQYAHVLYAWSVPWLDIVGRRRGQVSESKLGDSLRGGDDDGFDVIVVGIGRYGGRIAHELQARGRRVLGVDFDPEILRKRHREGLMTIYADVDDSETFHNLPLRQTDWVISTLPTRAHGRAILNALRDCGYSGRVALTAQHDHKQVDLLNAGADLVLMPFRDAATEAVDLIMQDDEKGPPSAK